MKYGLKKIYKSSMFDTTIGNQVVFDLSIGTGSTIFNNMEGLVVCDINGNLSVLEGDDWMVVSYEDTDVISISDIVVVSKYINVYRCSNVDNTLLSYFDFTTLDSHGAYNWGLYLNQLDNVIQYVTDQGWASKWVKYIRTSDFDYFKAIITDQEWVYFWATELDSSEFLDKLTDQELLFKYIVFFPNRKETVIQRITDPFWLKLAASITTEVETDPLNS